MDKSAIIELAKSEVLESSQYDSNPEVRGFKSIFDNEIRSRINDLSTAIDFYESLSDDEIERRYSVHYWEECALGVYDELYFGCLDFLRDQSTNKN